MVLIQYSLSLKKKEICFSGNCNEFHFHISCLSCLKSKWLQKGNRYKIFFVVKKKWFKHIFLSFNSWTDENLTEIFILSTFTTCSLLNASKHFVLCIHFIQLPKKQKYHYFGVHICSRVKIFLTTIIEKHKYFARIENILYLTTISFYIYFVFIEFFYYIK